MTSRVAEPCPQRKNRQASAPPPAAKSAKNGEKSETKTVKKIAKSRSDGDSYSVSEAASRLGVSIPTVKRMIAEDRIDSFRTPGGHLRILAESIEAVREHRQAQARPVRQPSPVLQNRR